MRCPNCRAVFESEINNGKAVCPYCDSEILIEPERPQNPINGMSSQGAQAGTWDNSGIPLSKRIFCSARNLDTLSEASMYKQICGILDSGENTVERYCQILDAMAEHYEYQATQRVDSDVLYAAINDIKNYDKNQLAYYYMFSENDNEVYEIFITNKNLYCRENQNDDTLQTLRLDQIKTLGVGEGGATFSDDINEEEIDVDELTQVTFYSRQFDDIRDFFTVIAFVCKLAYESNPSDCEIEVLYSITGETGLTDPLSKRIFRYGFKGADFSSAPMAYDKLVQRMDSLPETSPYKKICSFLDNEENTIERYCQLLDDAAANNKFQATQKVHRDLLYQMISKIPGYDKDQVPYFYKDEGIFSTGKEGVLITNKNVYKINKKKVEIIQIDQIKKMYGGTVGSGMFIDDGSKFIQIGAVNCMGDEHAMIVSFICKIASELNPSGCKILYDSLS